MSMEIIYFVTGLFALLFVLIYYSSLKPALTEAPKRYKKNSASTAFVVLMAFAFILRIIIATTISGHRTDMTCFTAWSSIVYNDGMSNFYFSGGFADYPPGYMYVLWFMGWLRSVFSWDDAAFYLVIKLPAILCDMATAWLIYKMAIKYTSETSASANTAQRLSGQKASKLAGQKPLSQKGIGAARSVGLCISMLFLFNPAILLNSAAWGQVDSVWTLLLLVCIYLLIEKKFVLACTAFVAGALIKPQTGMFALIIAFAAVKMLMEDKSLHKRESLTKIATALGIGLALTFLTMLPFAKGFNFGPIIDQYVNTVNSYPYGSVNAFNLFWLFKGGWENPSLVPGATNIENPFMFMTFSIWSNIFIVLVMAASVWFFVRWYKKHRQDNLAAQKPSDSMPNLFLYAAFTILGIFTLAGRMHERYAYPAVALLACAFLYKKDIRVLWMFFAASILQFLNSSMILYMDLVNQSTTPPQDALVPIIAVANIVLFVFLFKVCKRGERSFDSGTPSGNSAKDSKLGAFMTSLSQREPGFEHKPKRQRKMVRIDYIIMAAVTLLYSGVALFNLGDMRAPETYWESLNSGTGFTVAFDEDTYVSEIKWFTGCYEERKVTMTTQYYNSADPAGGIDPNNVQTESLNLFSVFAWHSQRVDDTVHSMTFVTSQDKIRINELVFLDADGNPITPVSVEAVGGALKLEALFDEQDIVPELISYKNSSYFDEIYHARTAYEFIEGLYPYETTHPPLGKVFISWGIMIFGMNPFGWRIIGTLFGIFMLPLIYLFAKRMFGSTKIAALTIILFAADFMHFVQTRIATIDVYITFFIILMYYFMYRYYTMNFYRDKFWKTLAMLALSGIAMGLGIASKWTGAYAAIGLAVLLFTSLTRRWLERRRIMRDKSSTPEQRTMVAAFTQRTVVTLSWCVLFFLIVPALIYGASYAQFNRGWINEEILLQERTPSSTPGYEYLQGKARTLYTSEEYLPAIVDEETKETLPWAGLRILVNNQTSMLSYHSNLTDSHPYSSSWWQWPLNIRPVWYFSTDTPAGERMTIASFGNPAVWWVGLLALLACIWIGLRRRDKKALFLVIGFLSQFLPWVLITRVTFLYHYFVCIPFLLLMIAYAADYLLCKAHNTAVNTGGNALRNMSNNLWIYAGICITLFVLFYPALSGAPASPAYINSLKWLGSWTF